MKIVSKLSDFQLLCVFPSILAVLLICNASLTGRQPVSSPVDVKALKHIEGPDGTALFLHPDTGEPPLINIAQRVRIVDGDPWAVFAVWKDGRVLWRSADSIRTGQIPRDRVKILHRDINAIWNDLGELIERTEFRSYDVSYYEIFVVDGDEHWILTSDIGMPKGDLDGVLGLRFNEAGVKEVEQTAPFNAVWRETIVRLERELLWLSHQKEELGR